MFNHERLVFARLRRGLSQRELAEALGVTTRSIYKYENGKSEPDISSVSKILDFPEKFFFGEDLPKIEEHNVSFRSMSKTSAKLKNIACSYGVIAFLLNNWFESEFDMPVDSLPDLSDLDPEHAAESLRSLWGLGEAPIGCMIDLLESKGIRVFSLAMETKDVDAFSVWRKNQPFIFLNSMKSSERSRFDAAHELGHLVRDAYSMKHNLESTDPRDIENQANAFASAFLMPKRAVISYKTNFVNVDTLIDQKQIWGVSSIALAYRMRKIGLVSEWIYARVLCPEISRRGYRVNEPKPMPHETSSLIKKIFKSLHDEGITVKDIATAINVSEEDIYTLTFGLSGPPLKALGKSKENRSINIGDTSHLKIIKN